MFCDYPVRLLLQFHITGRCNLRCVHCYRTEGDVEPLSTQDVIMVLEQFKALQKEYNARYDVRTRGHVNITGGEPFFREDIKQILLYLGDNKKYFSYGILSNGSFIDADMVQVLKKTDISFVQLSIDGNEDMHDRLRAPGDYARVLKTAEFLENNKIKTYISFTANKENYSDLPHVAKECRKRGITKLWSDRLVPIGNGETIKNLAIGREELPDYLKYLKKAQGNRLMQKLYPKTEVAMNRALQFQTGKGKLYSCSAGKSLITVDECGNIMPCRRMPILCGNVKETTLTEVYFQHEVFHDLRIDCIPKVCASCQYAYVCKGGGQMPKLCGLGVVLPGRSRMSAVEK